MLLVPVLGFGPDVEADPLGVLQALVDGHRAAGNLVEQGERGEIRRGRQDTGAVKVPLRNSSRRWENDVDDEDFKFKLNVKWNMKSDRF